MKQSQYQNDYEYDQRDPFMEYVDSLPDPEITVTRKVERDIKAFEEQKEQERQKKFRIRTFAIAAAVALLINLPRVLIADRNERDYSYRYPDEVVEVIDYDYGDGLLDDDLKEPEVLIDGEYHHFPFPVSDLIDEGWEVAREDRDTEVGPYEDFITLVNGDEELHVVSVISPDGTTVDPEDALITGFVTYASDETDVVLPGGIKPGVTTEEELVQQMRDSGLSWSYDEYEYEGEVTFKYYKCYVPVEDDHFRYYIIEFSVYKDGVVQDADLWLVDFEYPSGLEDAVNS